MFKPICYFLIENSRKKIIMQSLKPSSVSSTTLKLIHCQKRSNFEREIYHNSQSHSFYSFSLREKKLSVPSYSISSLPEHEGREREKKKSLTTTSNKTMNKNGHIFKKAKIWDLQVVWWHLLLAWHFLIKISLTFPTRMINCKI